MGNEIKTIEDYVVATFEQAQATIKNKSSLYIVGGQFSSAERALSTFLAAWSNDSAPRFNFQWWSMLAFFRAGYANLTEISKQADLLERVRLFGLAGDLDIRRDGEIIYWRYISETDTALPELTQFGIEAYPDNGKTFAKDERSYLLWRRDPQEQRVRHDWAAGLEFTHLQQVHYLENGRIAFVRYVEFCNGGSS